MLVFMYLCIILCICSRTVYITHTNKRCTISNSSTEIAPSKWKRIVDQNLDHNSVDQIAGSVFTW